MDALRNEEPLNALTSFHFCPRSISQLHCFVVLVVTSSIPTNRYNIDTQQPTGPGRVAGPFFQTTSSTLWPVCQLQPIRV